MTSALDLPLQPAVELSRVRAARPTPRRFRPDIQGLRAVAILAVALYHAGVPFLQGGFIGVDVFFVISGFLITRQLYDEAAARGRVNLIRFYSARFRRLLPPVFLVITSTLGMAHFVLPYDELKSLVVDVYYAAFYGVNVHFAAAGVQYQNAAAPPSAIQHFWSLAVEEQFYAIWPMLILLCALVRRSRLRHGLTIAVIAALTAGALAYSATVSASQASLAYFSLQTRAWELGFGALVALTADRWATLPPTLARWGGWGGLAAILGSACFYDSGTVYPGVAAVVPVLGAAVLLGAGVLRNERSVETAVLERPFMQYGGKVSYAWYLWHWPMLVLLPVWVGHTLNVWENLEIVCLAFWFATLTRFLENAAHRSRWDHRRWMSVGLGLSTMVAAVALLGSMTLPSLVGTGVATQSFTLQQADLSSVQRAVNQSLSIEAVPANLTPRLTRATSDTPWQGSSTCFGSLADTSTPLCAFGDASAPASRTAVLVGDSHAEQWLTPLSLGAAARGWKIVELTKAACPVTTLPVWSNDLRREYSECDAFHGFQAQAVFQIRPALIIASEANETGEARVSGELWASSTLDRLNQLAGRTARIAFIGDTPTTFDNTVACLQRHLSDARTCAYSRADAYRAARSRDYRDRYDALGQAMTRAKVGYVDTVNFFCGRDWCPAVVNNMLVHRDEGHITNTYAMWLRPMFMPILEGASS